MKLEIVGYRPAVIDEELYRVLEDFHGFRYLYRHSYSFKLDWDRERLVARKLKRAGAWRRQGRPGRHSSALMGRAVGPGEALLFPFPKGSQVDASTEQG